MPSWSCCWASEYCVRGAFHPANTVQHTVPYLHLCWPQLLVTLAHPGLQQRPPSSTAASSPVQPLEPAPLLLLLLLLVPTAAIAATSRRRCWFWHVHCRAQVVCLCRCGLWGPGTQLWHHCLPLGPHPDDIGVLSLVGFWPVGTKHAGAAHTQVCTRSLQQTQTIRTNSTRRQEQA